MSKTPSGMRTATSICVTERRGSPHTLVATKNEASYRRRANQRRQDLEHVAALGG